jgi:hypothetical protein
MTKYVLLAGVATALAMAPTAALAQEGGGNYDGPITFENHVSTTVYNASYDFDLTGMIGGVVIRGTIDPDSAAHAITDAKQLTSDESVSFSDPTDDRDDPARVRNNATSGAVRSDGNTGVNVAAGQYNTQQNSANIAVVTDDDGWASAATTGYQSLTDTNYGVDVRHFYQDRNNATAGAVNSNGNVGVNVAAGAFNQQQNLMTLAVADNAVLAQSNAALWQTASYNAIDIQDQRNNATSGAVNGNGNIGVNVAAGVGNQQQNSLTAAVSGTFGG